MFSENAVKCVQQSTWTETVPEPISGPERCQKIDEAGTGAEQVAPDNSRCKWPVNRNRLELNPDEPQPKPAQNLSFDRMTGVASILETPKSQTQIDYQACCCSPRGDCC